MLYTLIYTKKIIENDIIFLQSQLQTKKLLLQEIKSVENEN